MKIAVASGKGGTGKTSVASSLFLARPGTLGLDLDVEEPNMGILLGSPEMEVRPVYLPVAVIDANICTRCGLCTRECAYGALAMFGTGAPVVNETLCRGCGLCPRICPVQAITEANRQVGEVMVGTADGSPFIEGRLKVGSINSVHVIESAVKEASAFDNSDWVIDCAPGAACPVAAALRAADLALLVTEPTPFGRSDLEGLLELTSEMGIPAALVINKTGMGDASFDDICERYGVEVLARYPFSRALAESGARGESPYRADVSWARTTDALWKTIEGRFS